MRVMQLERCNVLETLKPCRVVFEPVLCVFAVCSTELNSEVLKAFHVLEKN